MSGLKPVWPVPKKKRPCDARGLFRMDGANLPLSPGCCRHGDEGGPEYGVLPSSAPARVHGSRLSRGERFGPQLVKGTMVRRLRQARGLSAQGVAEVGDYNGEATRCSGGRKQAGEPKVG